MNTAPKTPAEPQEYTYPDEEYLYALDSQHIHHIDSPNAGTRYFVNIDTSSTGSTFVPIKFQIDTVATCNTISIGTVTTHFPEAKITASRYRLYPYGNADPIKPVGQVELLCDRGRKFHNLSFQILSDSLMKDKPALLSGKNCEQLGLIQVKADEVYSLTNQKEPQNSQQPSKQLPPPGQLQKTHLLNTFNENFNGIGKLGPPVHFRIIPDAQPIQVPTHRTPVAKRQKEKEAIDRYVQLGILKPVTEPTPWCSNMLIRETPKKFRVCIDPSQTINKVIQRPIFQINFNR